MSTPRTDHLVYAVPDLAAAIDQIEREWGVRPAVGGKHPTGTHNALLALGPHSYLEIIAPDPEQPDASGRSFGLDQPTAKPSLRHWAVAVDDIEAAIAHAQEEGYDPGRIKEGSRARPDGVRLAWRSTIQNGVWPPPGDGLVPFVIEWGEGTPHPASDAPTGCRLISLQGEHPQPSEVQSMLRALGIEMEVSQAEGPTLIATIETPKGRVELHS